MCTLIALKGVHPRWPLLLGANRDEFYGRASTVPRVVHEAPRAVAGVDRAKGGTWMGANERGVFVALTNQREWGGPDARRASRGEVVMNALAMESVEEIDDLLSLIDPADYNGFNLFYGDAATLKVAYARPSAQAIETEALPDGIWVLPNDRIGSRDFPKTERAHALAAPIVARDDAVEATTRILGDHETPPLDRVPAPPPGSRFDHGMVQLLQALCIHTPVYGTKSATVLALDADRVAHYLFADGPPCQTPFVEYRSLFS